jgi:hypothetical protein
LIRHAAHCFTVLHGNNAGKGTIYLAEVAPVSDPRQAMQEFQRMADRVCVLILSSDLPAVGIEIQKAKIREPCLELYPDRGQLYEMVYESRFQRLWDQFRGELEEL